MIARSLNMRKPSLSPFVLSFACLSLMLLGFSTAGFAQIQADPAGAPEGQPGIPDGGGPVDLTLDNGTSETPIGDGGQFVWLNVFTPAAAEFPIVLDQVQAIFGPTGTSNGDAVDIVVFEDTDEDGDPGTGAVHLATYNDVIINNDNLTFNVYTLDPPVTLNGPGDVHIGIINRFSSEGGGDFPAGLDQTASQVRSWAASYLAGDAPDPPFFPADEQWGTIDSFGFPGNWVVRGSGQTVLPPPSPTIEIPTLSGVGLVLMLALIGGVAMWALRRKNAV